MAARRKSDGQEFEKLVAALQVAEEEGAQVQWDEWIQGRQFDVTIRRQTESGVHLTLVECKDLRHPIKVEQVDAFVTKAGDAEAHRKILFSAAGFQSGCFRVAKKHGVELFELRRVNEIPAKFLKPGAFARGVDPVVFENSYKIKDPVSGSVRHISGWDIDFGFGTVLEAGRFYHNPNLRTSCACTELTDGKAKLIVLEMKQHDLSLIVELTVDAKSAQKRLIEIRDPAECARLQHLLEEFQAAVPRDTRA